MFLNWLLAWLPFMTPSCSTVCFPLGKAQEVHDLLVNVGVYHQTLCYKCAQDGRKLFNVTYKAHYVQHIALDILRTGFNPRFAWTYRDEDFMGRVAQVAKMCTKARGPLRLGEVFILRYRNVLYLRWSRRKSTL